MTTATAAMTATTMTTGEPARRRWWTSVRVRIVVGYVLLLAAALAISILVTRQVLVGRLERDIDRGLAQEVEELRSLATGTDPDTGEPFGADAEAILDTFLRRSVPGTNEAFYSFVDGRRFLSSYGAPQDVWNDAAVVARWATVEEPTLATLRSGGEEIRSLAVPLAAPDGVAGVFVAAHFPAADRDEVLLVVRVLSVAALVVLVASAVLAASLAGRVLRPVRDLTATARRISQDDLTQRIDIQGRDELAELGATFNAMIDRLQVGFEQQRRFLDDVAHELRTPITIVQGNLDLLGDDPEERAESVAIMNDELDRMNRYVNDLLLLAKAESGDLFEFAPVDLGDLAATIDQRVRVLGERDWRVAVAPPPGAVAILGDRARLLQAVLNLASNAVQHTDEGDRIEIGVEVADATACIWVHDAGPGIDDDVIEQLFTHRFRGAASRARRAEGMGIGLSIVDAIARGHGGRAIAENDAAGGARFTIELPIDPAPEDLP